jgi:hypothetical protein
MISVELGADAELDGIDDGEKRPSAEIDVLPVEGSLDVVDALMDGR